MYWHMVLAYVFRIRNWPALINVRCSIGGGIKSKSTSKAIQRASRKDAVSFLSFLFKERHSSQHYHISWHVLWTSYVPQALCLAQCIQQRKLTIHQIKRKGKEEGNGDTGPKEPYVLTIKQEKTELLGVRRISGSIQLQNLTLARKISLWRSSQLLAVGTATFLFHSFPSPFPQETCFAQVKVLRSRYFSSSLGKPLPRPSGTVIRKCFRIIFRHTVILSDTGLHFRNPLYGCNLKFVALISTLRQCRRKTH
eukprot:1157621-Pelagomonas_calceolata.AAC.4